jgi:uncharacterized protein YjbI with pentapeptide repeats
MANDDHIAKLKEGVPAWNAWRDENPDIRPDLSWADLSNVHLEVDLSGVDLNHADLIGVNLTGANLGEANLTEADLKHAELRRARLVDADLKGANLSWAFLSGAHLEGANLSRTNVRGTDLIEVNLFKANVSEADLRQAKLERARLVDADLKRANLSEANLSGAELSGADLSEADLSEAFLDSAVLNGADFSRSNLRGAHLNNAGLYKTNLSEANLFEANLNEARLSEVDLKGANLSEAFLERATLVDTDFTGADLTACRIYGVSAWGLKLEGAKQQNLIITPQGYLALLKILKAESRAKADDERTQMYERLETMQEPAITVDNIEVAQFLYLMLNNQKIKDVIDTITSKAVLILGRFTDERKAVLDALRDQLRKRDYLPILFDFAVPARRNITETVTLLARMARFIIADLTDPSSIPQELQAIIPSVRVPLQPVLLEGSPLYSMFKDFEDYPWVLQVHQYKEPEQLLAALAEKVIAPAEAKAAALAERRRKNEAELTKIP